jgi:hypothetical protein
MKQLLLVTVAALPALTLIGCGESREQAIAGFEKRLTEMRRRVDAYADRMAALPADRRDGEKVIYFRKWLLACEEMIEQFKSRPDEDPADELGQDIRKAFRRFDMDLTEAEAALADPPEAAPTTQGR